MDAFAPMLPPQQPSLEVSGSLGSLGFLSPLSSPNAAHSPHWPAQSSTAHMLPPASLPSPLQSSRTVTNSSYSLPHLDSAAALSDPALALHVHTHSGQATPAAQLTPLQSPLTPALTSFHHSDLFASNSVAAALSGSALLDGLHPSSSAAATPAKLSQDEEHEELELEAELEEEDEEEDERSIDLEEEERREQEAHAARNNRPDEESDPEDESYYDDEPHRIDDDESDASDEASEQGLVSWVAESQRNGVDPRTVLRRLLADFDDVPERVLNRFLWKTAYGLSMHIQQHLLRHSARRAKLLHVNTLDDLCGLIQKSSRIVVLTGAGISVSAGIPDFRSKGGIYPRLRDEFGMESPESMFDLEYFRANPAIFYSFARELWPGAHQPTIAHRFIAMLEQKGKLLRNYTQNIDALESRAGIQNVLQCHGSFATARCMTCQRRVHGSEIHEEIMAKQIAKCTHCHPPGVTVESVEEETGEDGIDRCKTFGVMKPEIVFFGESLPEAFRTCLQTDRHEADLVLVMGSSLKVQPVAGILQLFDKSTPMCLINREVVGEPDEFDVEVLGFADEVCSYLANKLGWTLPEIDPNSDTFRPLSNEGEEKSAAPAAASALTSSTAAASASNLTPPSLSVAAPPRPPSPLFVPPNRYIFSGSSSSPMPPSTSVSPESVALPPAMEEELERSMSQHTPLHSPSAALAAAAAAHSESKEAPPAAAAFSSAPVAPSTPLQHDSQPKTPQSLTPLRSPFSSPKSRQIRPPPLQLAHSSSTVSEKPNEGEGGGGLPCHDSVGELNLTCTPTKSARCLLTPGYRARSTAHPPQPSPMSPHFRPLPPTAHQPANGQVSDLGKRKSSADTATPSSAHPHASPHAGTPGCALSHEVAAGVSLSSPLSSPHPHPSLFGLKSAAAVAPDEIHQPAVKRRKVSESEKKAEV